MVSTSRIEVVLEIHDPGNLVVGPLLKVWLLGVLVPSCSQYQLVLVDFMNTVGCCEDKAAVDNGTSADVLGCFVLEDLQDSNVITALVSTVVRALEDSLFSFCLKKENMVIQFIIDRWRSYRCILFKGLTLGADETHKEPDNKKQTVQSEHFDRVKIGKSKGSLNTVTC